MYRELGRRGLSLLQQAAGEGSPAWEAQGTSPRAQPHLAQPAGLFLPPPPNQPVTEGRKRHGSQSREGKTPPAPAPCQAVPGGQRGPGCGRARLDPALASQAGSCQGERFCKSLAGHFTRSAVPELLCGKGGPWEGRGPQLCSRVLMNGAFVLTAAAPFPRQPRLDSAEEENRAAPPHTHPDAPGPAPFTLPLSGPPARAPP